MPCDRRTASAWGLGIGHGLVKCVCPHSSASWKSGTEFFCFPSCSAAGSPTVNGVSGRAHGTLEWHRGMAMPGCPRFRVRGQVLDRVIIAAERVGGGSSAARTPTGPKLQGPTQPSSPASPSHSPPPGLALQLLSPARQSQEAVSACLLAAARLGLGEVREVVGGGRSGHRGGGGGVEPVQGCWILILRKSSLRPPSRSWCSALPREICRANC